MYTLYDVFMGSFGMIFRIITSNFIAKSEVILQNFIQKKFFHIVFLFIFAAIKKRTKNVR